MRMHNLPKSAKIGLGQEKTIMKKCPFNFDECTPECALFIAPSDINEFVSNRLTSIGVFDRENGMCSFKHKALAKSREVFEKSQQNKF